MVCLLFILFSSVSVLKYQHHVKERKYNSAVVGVSFGALTGVLLLSSVYSEPLIFFLKHKVHRR